MTIRKNFGLAPEADNLEIANDVRGGLRRVGRREGPVTRLALEAFLVTLHRDTKLEGEKRRRGKGEAAKL
jgi:hypothetical protein